MKKINYLFLLLVMCICTTANAQGFHKKITAIGDALTAEAELVSGNYYLLRNIGRSGQVIRETGTGVLTFNAYDKDNFISNSLTSEVMASVVCLTSETEGQWKIQFASGNFMPVLGGNGTELASNADAEQFTIIHAGLTDPATAFGIQGTTNTQYLNGQAARPVPYHVAPVSDGNSRYEILPLTVEDVSVSEYTFEYKFGDVLLTTDKATFAVGSEYSYTPQSKVADFFAPNSSTVLTGTVVAAGETITIPCTEKLPMKSTSLDADGKFTSNPALYKLHFTGKNKWVKYVRNEETPSESNILCSSQYGNEPCFWYFVTTGEISDRKLPIVCLYNVAESTPLSYSSAANGQVVNFNKSENNVRFEMHKRSDNGAFALSPVGSDFGVFTDDADDYVLQLSYWNYYDAGSQIEVVEADVNAAYLACTGNPEGKIYVGAFSASDVATLTPLLNEYTANPTPANLTAYYSARNSATQTELDVNKYYRVISYNRHQGLTSKNVDIAKNAGLAGADGWNERKLITAAANDEANATYKDLSSIWKFEEKNNGEYYWLRNANVGLTVSIGANDLVTNPWEDDNSANFVLETKTSSSIEWCFKVSNNGTNYLNASNGAQQNERGVGVYGLLDWWGNVDASNKWYIEEVNSVDIDITAAGWATLCLPFEVQIPTGVKAYIGGESNGSYLKLTEITGVIPANEPVLLEGAEDTYTFVINTTATADKSTTNTLSGTTVKRTGFSTETPEYMALSAKNDVGMYQSKSATIPANKAYYVPQSAGVNALLFSFGDEATGIDSVAGADGQQEVFYDLNGRRVAKPTRGIYVTGNGKKVFFTK